MAGKKKKTKRKKKIGLPPGSLIYTGNIENATNQLELYHFEKDSYSVFNQSDIHQVISKINKDDRFWLQIEGIDNIKIIQEIGEAFNIDKLVLEDILDITQRPKCEIFDDFIFFTLKTLHQDSEIEKLNRSRQISIILKDNLIISFYEQKEKWITNLVERLQKKDSPIKKKPIDYLFYRILDTIVDYYYDELENLEEKIEDLELNIYSEIDDNSLQSIQKLKKDLIYFRKTIFPLREAISLIRKDNDLISDKVESYLTEVYEHVIHIVETIESYRDLTSGLLDLYMTGISNRMNEIMKVLTIIATIFIPLTFVAGVYGMNFKYMPELDYRWAYPICLLVMLLIAIIMLLYFKRKKWL